MNSVVQIFLALLGAALLGSIIGWIARRIVAIRAENALHQKHAEEVRSVKNTLAQTNANLEKEKNKSAYLDNEITRLNGEAIRLEQAALKNSRLDETLVASNLELAEARSRNQILSEKLSDQDDELRRVKEELNTQRFIARNSSGISSQTNPDLQSAAESVQSAGIVAALTSNDTEFQPASRSQQSSTPPLDFYDDELQDSDIDQDISDMTADIMGLMEKESGVDVLQAGDVATTSETQASEPAGSASGGFFSNFNRKKST